MDGGKGWVALIVGVIILAVVALTYVVRSQPAPSRAAAAVVKVEEPPVAVGLPSAGLVPPSPAGEVAKEDSEPFPGAPPVQQPPADPELGNKEDRRYVVPPVDEPEMTLDAKIEERADFVAALPNGGGYLFERKDAAGKRVSGVVVPGTIMVTRGLVELFGCAAGGKEHETVLRIECDMQSLDLALTSAGFRRGNLPANTDLKEAGQGSRILILVQWNDRDGTLRTFRSEDLIISRLRNAPMPRVGWTYVAKWAEVEDPGAPEGSKRPRVLIAQNSRSGVATFRDSGALLDNPLQEAVDDTLFMANYMILPLPGTPVRVIFRAPSQAERGEIESVETAIAKETLPFKPDDREKK